MAVITLGCTPSTGTPNPMGNAGGGTCYAVKFTVGGTGIDPTLAWSYAWGDNARMAVYDAGTGALLAQTATFSVSGGGSWRSTSWDRSFSLLANTAYWITICISGGSGWYYWDNAPLTQHPSEVRTWSKTTEYSAGYPSTLPTTTASTVPFSLGLEGNTAVPTVLTISPVKGDRAGGTAVTITGRLFTGATGAAIGGVPLTNFSVVNATTITGTTGAYAGTAGQQLNVVVTAADTTTATLAGGFSYTELPANGTLGCVPATGTPGSTFAVAGSKVYATRYTSNNRMTYATTLWSYVWADVAIFGVYDAETGTLLGQTASLSVTAGGSWRSIALDRTVVLKPNHDYWIVSCRADASSATWYGYTNAALSQHHVETKSWTKGTEHSTGFPDTLPTLANDSGAFALGLTGTDVLYQATFDGVSATNIELISEDIFDCDVPVPHAAGSVDVVVTIGSLTATSPGGYTYQNAMVYLDGRPAIDIVVIDDDTIEATTIPHAPGPVDVRVLNGNVDATKTDGYTYDATPGVLSITPNRGPTAGGTKVRVVRLV